MLKNKKKLRSNDFPIQKKRKVNNFISKVHFVHNKIIFLTLIALIGITTNFAWAQEISHSTFQETAQLVIDKSISQNVTASITLQSTSIQEMKISSELEREIREDNRVKAVILTNQVQCVLGVIDESCIMVNVERNPEDRGIIMIQENSRKIGDEYIDKINQIFDTNAKYHSVYVHTNDLTNTALETSGVISGKGIISVVYTLPMEDTDSMYDKISALLIPKIIRDGEGFYKVARDLSKNDNAKMTFSMLPMDSKSLLQLKLAVNYPNQASGIIDITPLKFFNIENINRSGYFSSEFYPLNSIIQVVVLSPENTNVSDVNGNIVESQIIDNEKIPMDITKQGWIFDPEEGQRIQGKYIFGKETTVSGKELEFSLGGINLQTEKQEFDESIVVVVIITVVAIAAAIFYLKGYKK